jgi:hypothetical protein
MDRSTDQRTQARSEDWERVLSGRWGETVGQDERQPDSGERPARPLLDRLTQVGLGQWVSTKGTGGRRES